MRRRLFITGLLSAPLFARPAFAAASVFSADGVAINGTDPVSYFANGGPVFGDDRYRLRWHGAIWRFANASNMARFERDPYALSPQYGGYCAMTLAQGELAPSIPDAWAMHAGRLYLVQSIAARDQWLEGPEPYLAQSDTYWPQVICR